MIVLSDLDGVGADWDGNFDSHALSDAYAHLAIPRRHERKSFTFYDDVEPHVRDAIVEIMNHPTYYADLKPIPGWDEAMRKLDEKGHQVFIVTTPWWTNPDCMRDKADWIATHLGEEWRKRVILTGDKTVVRGDVLIDDKPDIKGVVPHPSWTQILFDQPYNQHVGLPRIRSWESDDWESLMQEAVGL